MGFRPSLRLLCCPPPCLTLSLFPNPLFFHSPLITSLILGPSLTHFLWLAPEEMPHYSWISSRAREETQAYSDHSENSCSSEDVKLKKGRDKTSILLPRAKWTQTIASSFLAVVTVTKNSLWLLSDSVRNLGRPSHSIETWPANRSTTWNEEQQNPNSMEELKRRKFMMSECKCWIGSFSY